MPMKRKTLEKAIKNEEKPEDEKLFLVLVIMLVIIVAGFIFAMNLRREPEKFSEVYIEKTLSEVNSNESFTAEFFIENHEKQETTYNYKVISSQETKTGKVTLKDEEKKSIKEEMLFPFPLNEKQQISIEVKKENNENEEEKFNLWFWVKVN